MTKDADREYHTERARAELDLSYKAENMRVAEAHMRLSALHMERARESNEPASPAEESAPDASASPTAA